MNSNSVLSVFNIDALSDVPPFQQIHASVVDALASGKLVPGTQLPTVRALAAHLNLAANTVASGYRSLEAAGLVEGRGRAGTFVRLGAAGPADASARKIALEAAQAFARVGVDRARAAELINDAYRASEKC